MHTDIETLISSLLEGGVFALLAISLSLVFGVMKIVNLAQGDFMALGMYAMVFLAAVVHLPSPILALVLFVPGVIVGVLVYKVMLTRGTGGGGAIGGFSHSQLLLTFALSLVIETVLQIAWGGTPRTIKGNHGLSVWHIGGFVIDKSRFAAFVIALVVGVGLLIFLRATQTGRRIRATADDEMAAQMIGINVARVRTIVFATSIGLAGIAGGILIGYYPVTPTVGSNFLFYVFAALALGGLGNVFGAFIGGMVIGLAQGVGEIWIPLQLDELVVFGIFLVVIFFRPNGILGQAVRL